MIDVNTISNKIESLPTNKDLKHDNIKNISSIRTIEYTLDDVRNLLKNNGFGYYSDDVEILSKLEKIFKELRRLQEAVRPN